MFAYLWMAVIVFSLHQAKVLNVTDTTIHSNIICPSSEACQIVCFSEQSCSNIEIHCNDNDYECSVYCSTNACQHSRIYFINALQSKVICSRSTNSPSHSQSCLHSEIYIEPKNDTSSTVWIDIQSQTGYLDHIQINYKGNAPFPNHDPISHHSNGTTPVPIYPVTILCRNHHSCRDTHITISSVTYFKLHCLSNQSCYNLQMDFISYDDENRGALDMVCNGSQACYNANINAITAHKFKMICDSSVGSCSSASIRCPIHSTVQVTENSCVLQCVDEIACSDAVVYAMYGMIQLNNPNINPLHVDNVSMYCGYDFDATCVIGQDCNSICAPMDTTQRIQIVLPFNDQTGISIQLECDASVRIDICVILMSAALVRSAHCGNSSLCMVVCMNYTHCGGPNSIVNGTTADAVRLHTLQRSYFQFLDIYGPMNGEFMSDAQMNGTTLYLSETKDIEIICSSEQNCVDLLIFANDTHTVTIHCRDPFSCQSVSVFVTNMDHDALNASPIPYCTLSWHCGDGCANNTNTLVINTPHSTNSMRCGIHLPDVSSNEWLCDQYPLSISIPCILAANTTDDPITSTQVWDDNSLTNSVVPTAWLLGTSAIANSNNKETFWAQSGGLLGIGILVLCCCSCVFGLLRIKNLVQKKIANAKSAQNAAKKIQHTRTDTVGSTVEDIIKESAALPFTNPLEPNIADNIRMKRNTLTASDIAASMKPPEEHEYKFKVEDEKRVELQFGSIGHHKQRHSNRSMGSNYVYGYPQGVCTMTMEGSMDLESRMNRSRYSTDMDTVTMSFERSRTLNLTPPTKNSMLGVSSHDIGNQRTFSSPSVVVSSIYETRNHLERNGGDLSSSEDSDGMYESVSTQRAEGGKPTNTTKGDDSTQKAATQATSE